MKEIRVFGPPGCGKTTTLTKYVKQGAEKYGADKLMVASFTRTAAQEIAGRDLGIPESKVATLHAHCFRAIGTPKIAEDSKNLKLWNEKHPGKRITGGGVNLDDPDMPSLDEDGDRLLCIANTLRARRVPTSQWPAPVAAFMAQWCEFKSENHFMDFTDLIEYALDNIEFAPDMPTVGIFDEYQDFTPLEIALVRKWSEHMEYAVVAGDEDQLLYGFKGCDPRAFLEPDVPAEQKQILRQSYRVPRAVHSYASKITGRISYREPKEYRPRDEEGEVKCLSTSYTNPDMAVQLAQKLTADGETCMFLASCGYMLHSVMKTLKESGVPSGNRYRQNKKQWNPLDAKARDIILSFARKDRLWTWKELTDILPIISADYLVQGAKTRIDMETVENENEELKVSELLEYFLPQTLDEILGEATAKWLLDHAIASRRESLRYAVEAFTNGGSDALLKAPRCTVGTIHCSPGDELVLTKNRGEVKIEELDPEEDRLVSYDRKCNRIVGGHDRYNSDGYKFIREKNRYSGDMITIRTDSTSTRVTPTHFLEVKFSENFFEKYIVYLMRRKDWWRVGICVSGHRPYKSGGITGRMASEKADDGWILKVCETREEAIEQEAIIQGRYGITGLTFEASKNRSLSTDSLHRVHDTIRVESNKRIIKLMYDFGIMIDQPLCSRHTKRSNKRGMFLTWASNFISGYMEIPTFDKSGRPIMKIAKSERKNFMGFVYSLDVERHHHYVSGGAVVHNSVKGGEADNVFLFPDISQKASAQWVGKREEKDTLYRQFYVGATRARKRLFLCMPATKMFFEV
jgi:hypothetical protein